MRLGKCLVELYRSERRDFRFCPRYLRGQQVRLAQELVSIGQPRPRRCVASVFLNGLFELFDAFSDTLLSPLVPLATAPEIQVICVGVHLAGAGTRHWTRLRR